MIGDYIPQVHLEDMCINLGAPPFLHVLFGGLKPDCYAEMCVASFDLLRQQRNN